MKQKYFNGHVFLSVIHERKIINDHNINFVEWGVKPLVQRSDRDKNLCPANFTVILVQP